MWLLSCEGDLFDGKRLWLRPGSTHLLGRTSGKSANSERVQYIDHKSVSRKHLVLKVADTKPGDSTLLHVKSEVQAIDGSKTGTTIDGDKFNNGTRVLNGDAHTIKLGSYAFSFQLQWRPVIISLTTLPKAAKVRADALASHRQRLEHAGVKVVTEYVTNQTTHLIAKKRNTAAGLQALVQGRWILTESFVNALAEACERKEGEENGEPSISLLEQDFDINWPKEDEHIVPPGGEPVQRPNEDLIPRPERAEIFESFTFVFLSQSQYEQLLPVVTSGGGKAAVYPFELGESTTDDVVNFVKELAGHKASSRVVSLSQPGGRSGIVIVRSISKEEGREQDIMRDIEITFNQRSMEQNEFLDAILTNNASSLIRPLREASQTHSPGRSVQRGSSSPVDETTVIESPRAEETKPNLAGNRNEENTQESSAAIRRRNRQLVTASRFKGFDDFDPSQTVQPDDNDDDNPSGPSVSGRGTSQRTDVQGDGDDTRKAVSRKRRAPYEDPIEAERRMLDSLAPSTTVGAKRLRLQQRATAQTSAAALVDARPVVKADDSTNILNMDIKGALKERREQEEERRRQDEEYLRNALDMDISEIRKRVQVENFELPVRSSAQHIVSEGQENDKGWDPAWNGRQNFKKFRRLRKSQPDDEAPSRRPKRLVALEEVPRKGFHTDEGDYLSSSIDQNSRGRSRSHTQSQSLQPSGEPSEGDPHTDRLAFQRRIERSRAEDVEAAELSLLVPDESSTNTQTLVLDSQRQSNSKRLAAEPLSGVGKKPRQNKVVAASLTRSARHAVSDDDDDDELKFRRKKR